ncbi:hypothetical protein KIW84_055469 [Lathyrus oleraceus]|uniref:Uncharacterized protein n=1 Tax=Pisum sativum TaxID=3888 RepID=A0A9D4WY10_PEA|nr:hypothetical protein KIW84_055469 [Pisum sativum]
MEPLSGATLSPVKSSDISSSGLQFKLRGSPSVRNNDISNNSLRQLCCKIILTSLEFSLKPVTYAEIFNHMLNWLLVSVNCSDFADKPKKQVLKAVEKVLAGSIRREMALEEFCSKHTTEIMQLNRLMNNAEMRKRSAVIHPHRLRP